MKKKPFASLTTVALIVTMITLFSPVLVLPVSADVPVFDAGNFDEPMANLYHPLVPGTGWIYSLETDEGTEMAYHTVTHETKTILGVETTVFTEMVTLDGILVEFSVNWFAADNDGNVWYFGEDSKDYEDGEVASTAGSWEAGVDDAMPGIIMLGNPEIGDQYQEEDLPGTAEDMAEVVALDEIVSCPYGTYNNCLKTRNWNPLEPGEIEYKYYYPGLGLLGEEDDEEEELVLITIIPPALSGTSVETNQAVFEGGDEFELMAEIINGTNESKTLNHYVILDIMGQYFFWPSWSIGTDFQTVTLNAGQEKEIEVLSFQWPAGTGSFNRVVCWSYMMDPATGNLFGHSGRCEFAFN